MLTVDQLRIEMGDFSLTGDLKIAPGARVAVLGPSGAGKSTLLAAIAGFQPLNAGRILWNDTAMPNDPAARPISMVFQDNNLFPHLTVAQNVGLGLRPNLRLSTDDHAYVAQALTRVGLEGMGDRKPAQLSGGQIARVALARVLLRDRPVLLLDEPFGALGPALKSEMLELVRTLLDETGATLLMVSHDPQDARVLCDQVVLVADGQALAPVATEEMFANPPEVMREYLGG
ncbi:thiamine transport system ATP-binding protein [Aliiroseovarius halocynthiae]|uniref:ATP-binding cassette domain-containing protein n=1 Tax=Aliiroseovarius halocynthiae TaxID=985055 RepID=A0A545SPY6_9RHOB|nr:ATP-binding cassette domain-containing protein [Aliiroseovarius halocynthiae]TQV67040.1 ATP-binding cassette domain-containing protein [Aliiroseovarius halocynthiae]SMR82241.1 thiamine transport system ATP-binding protein [Aliiroseovarius halocynthiae]